MDLMDMKTLYWKDDQLYLLDQTLLPHEVEYLVCGTYQDVIFAIKTLIVRGAPAIGVAAAFAMALAELAGDDLEKAAQEIKAARPTAVNLAWAVDRVLKSESIQTQSLDKSLYRISRLRNNVIAIGMLYFLLAFRVLSAVRLLETQEPKEEE